MPPRNMLALAPLGDLKVVPNVQAHLSAFSFPAESYQALRSGSVTDSSSSWLMIDAMASAPVFPLGLRVCGAQLAGQRAAFPMKAYLIFVPCTVCTLCHPQYCVQKPDDSLTSCEVSTKYTPLGSLGRLPFVIAVETIAATA